MEEVRRWVEDEHGRTRTGKDKHEKTEASGVSVREGPCPSVGFPLTSSALVANAALSLLNLCCHLLDRQLAAQAQAFESEGGFTERLYRIRSRRRGG